MIDLLIGGGAVAGVVGVITLLLREVIASKDQTIAYWSDQTARLQALVDAAYTEARSIATTSSERLIKAEGELAGMRAELDHLRQTETGRAEAPRHPRSAAR